MHRLGYKIVKNGIFVPFGTVSMQDLIYNEDLTIVQESCLFRGANRSENVSEPLARLPDTIKLSDKPLDTQLVFLGEFANQHWGHLLTEGLARYWYLLKYPVDNPIIPLGRKKHWIKRKIKRTLKPGNRDSWEHIYQCFGIKPQNLLITASPVRAKEIIVPDCSMYNRCEIHRLHWDVGKKVGMCSTNTSTIDRDPEPVYLSRTKLDSSLTTIHDEMPIEEYCRARGFKIAYPESMSLKEQVVLFNKHDVFVGCAGSAFHSLLFRFVDRKTITIYLMPVKNHNSNYKLIDEMMGNEAHYIDCIRSISGSVRSLSDPRKSYCCDTKSAIEGISNVLGKG